MEQVTINQFGKDHWSTFAYADSCISDNQPIDPRKMRTNETTHPLLAVNSVTFKFKPEHGSRLHGYFDEKSKGNDVSHLLLTTHDDWDCLEDCEKAGLVDIRSTINGIVKLTSYGEAVAAELRHHKANGGMFATFISSVEKPQSQTKLKI
jgi:hypothetical protein